MARILIIDDENNIRKTLGEILTDEGHEVIEADDASSGFAAFEREGPDVILLDIQMPGKDGLELLDDIKLSKTDCEVVMISGHGTIEAAVKAIKAGAFHFLQKPLSMIEVKQTVRHAAEAKQQRDELKSLRTDLDEKYKIIGNCLETKKLLATIEKVAPSQGRVLISGQSGTGKELVAYAIHRKSQRSKAPFVKINCAAIPQNLIESELFGHEKGAFTGAIATRKGTFERAHNGTLFLDEIGDMDMQTQTRVLRVIQEGEFERVGGSRTIRVDVRIIAATHQNLEAMIAQQRFREDLYYRLNVVPIAVPSLEQRAEDIPLLAAHFLTLYGLETGGTVPKFTQSALDILMRQKFPGNIRQLRNIVERLAIMATALEITADQLQSATVTKEQSDTSIFNRPMDLSAAKEALERMYVETQLNRNEWNISTTAEILGIERTNLHRKIRQLGIERI